MSEQSYFYDPSTGRFLTRDPIQDGRNWYAYCGNNPISAVDANGLHYLIIVINGGHVHVGLVDDRGNVVWVGGRPGSGGGGGPSGKPGSGSGGLQVGGMLVGDVPTSGTAYAVDISIDQYKKGRKFIAQRAREGIKGGHDYHASTNNCTHFADDLLEEIGIDISYESDGNPVPTAQNFENSIKETMDSTGLFRPQYWKPGERLPSHGELR